MTYDLEQTEKAIEAMNAFAADYPDSEHIGEINDLLSEAYLNTNNYNLAIEHVEKSGEVNRNLQGIYQKAAFMKGAELFNAENYEGAISAFSKSLKYRPDPEYAQMAHVWLGETYSVLQDYDKAAEQYQEALSRSELRNSPAGLRARYGLGYAYFNTKKYDEALIHFKAYVDGSGQSGEYSEDAVLRLADCYYVAKQYDLALQNYRNAIRNNKVDNDYAHLQAGVVTGIQGNVDEANREYDYILKNYPK